MGVARTIQMPKAKPTTIPFDEVWKGLSASVWGFAHYADDDPNLAETHLRMRVIWREFAALRHRRLRAEKLLKELLEAHVEENGGDLPTSDDHPAHAAREFLDEFEGK